MTTRPPGPRYQLAQAAQTVPPAALLHLVVEALRDLRAYVEPGAVGDRADGLHDRSAAWASSIPMIELPPRLVFGP